MFFFFIELESACKCCDEWQRHTNDGDGIDVGLCPVFKRLTLENYGCGGTQKFLKEIGLNHTTKCSECEFKSKDEKGTICKAKVRLKQSGWRDAEERTCPIRLIYKYMHNKKEEI